MKKVEFQLPSRKAFALSYLQQIKQNGKIKRNKNQEKFLDDWREN